MKALYEEYPKGDAAPRMLALLGDRCLQMRDTASAETYLRRLTADFPETPEAGRAAMLLGNPVFQKKN